MAAISTLAFCASKSLLRKMGAVKGFGKIGFTVLKRDPKGLTPEIEFFNRTEMLTNRKKENKDERNLFTNSSKR